MVAGLDDLILSPSRLQRSLSLSSSMTSPAAAPAAASSVPYASSITHGPPLYPPPADIPGLPTLAELRAVDVLFDWPTLKRFIREGCGRLEG
jgi:hypothetical protein